MDKKSYHHNNLKNELIEKGIELLSNYGLSQLSLRKVAQSCNVSHAAPYSHFANKEDLVAAMQLHITEQFTDKLLETIEHHKGSTDFLMEFGKAYISFFIEKPQYFTFLFQEGNIEINLDIDSSSSENYKPFVIYKEQILKLLENSDMPDDKKQDCIVALFAYIHGLASLATMKNVHYGMDWKSKLEDLISTLSFEV